MPPSTAAQSCAARVQDSRAWQIVPARISEPCDCSSSKARAVDGDQSSRDRAAGLGHQLVLTHNELRSKRCSFACLKRLRLLKRFKRICAGCALRTSYADSFSVRPSSGNNLACCSFLNLSVEISVSLSARDSDEHGNFVIGGLRPCSSVNRSNSGVALRAPHAVLFEQFHRRRRESRSRDLCLWNRGAAQSHIPAIYFTR